VVIGSGFRRSDDFGTFYDSINPEIGKKALFLLMGFDMNTFFKKNLD